MRAQRAPFRAATIAAFTLLPFLLATGRLSCVPVPVAPECEPADVSPIALAEGEVGPAQGTIRWTKTDPRDPDRLFVSDGGTLYRSETAGLSWTVQELPYPHNAVQALALHPRAPGTFYVALSHFGDSRLVKTVDDGRTWAELPLDPGLVIDSLAGDPNTPERLLVGTHWDGVFESLDGGATFAPTGLTEGIVLHLAVDPGDPDRLYAGTWGNDGFYRSADGGRTWTSAGAPGRTIQAFALDPADPRTLYVVVFGAGQLRDTLYRSRDGGESWTALYDGTLGGRGIYGVFVDPCDSDRIFLGARDAVVRSVDGGATWTHQADGFLASANVVIYGFGWAPGRRFAGGEFCGLYESTDGGDTWHHIAGLFCDNAPDIDQ